MSKRDIAEELHKPARRNYERRVVNVYGKNDLWQADLVDMVQYSRRNKGFKYILCVIDCYTKFAWATALKSKTAIDVTNAFSEILSTGRSPKFLQVDNGAEFYNKSFNALITLRNIKMYSTFSVIKASIVERFNRTLKSLMFKEFTARGTHNWYSILPMLMDKYNNSKHRTVGMTPVQADANPEWIRLKQHNISRRKAKFDVGDNVRISIHKGVFTKGYRPNWSAEIFRIVKKNDTHPPTYTLKDYTGKTIAGCFYSEEISKTAYPNDYLVEKIMRRKGERILVKWLGFDKAHNSWIKASDLRV